MNKSIYNIILISGTDRYQFLQGLITQDINRIKTLYSIPSAICNIKGRVISTCNIVKLKDSIGLAVPKSITNKVIDHLSLYQLRSDIKIKNSNKKYTAIAVNIKNLNSKSHSDLFTLIDNLGKKGLIATNNSKKKDYTEIYGDKKTINKFTIKTTQLLSEKEWNNAKIKSGLVDINRKTSELYTPHMLNLDLIGAISFDKGCYTGQEIVARTENLGRVKRRVNRYKLSTDKAKIGDELTLNNNKIGKIINVAKNNILAVTNVDNHQDVLEYKTYFAKPIELNY